MLTNCVTLFNMIISLYKWKFLDLIGQLPGQIIESEDMPMSNRPPIYPKPKVAPRGTADPQIITPDYYADSPASGGFGIDPKFSSLKVIQSGYTKKRIDLFEAL